MSDRVQVALAGHQDRVRSRALDVIAEKVPDALLALLADKLTVCCAAGVHGTLTIGINLRAGSVENGDVVEKIHWESHERSRQRPPLTGRPPRP